MLEGFATNGDASKWGLTDLYEEDEEILRKAVASGERFDTGWVGCRKEIRSMRIRREEKIVVECHAEMDSVFEECDLFSDFLTDDELDLLTEDMIENIRDALMMGDFCEEITYKDTLPAESTFEEIIQKVEELEQDCEDKLSESYRECISTTLYYLYPDREDLLTMISDRIEKYDA